MTTLLEILSSFPIATLVSPAIPAYFLSFFFSPSDVSVLGHALATRVVVNISLLDFIFPAAVLAFFACRQSRITFVVPDHDIPHTHDEEANGSR